MTDRQREVLDTIKDLYGGNGYWPSVREIGEALGIKSPNGVMCHLRALERDGYLTRPRENGKALARVWEINDEPQ